MRKALILRVEPGTDARKTVVMTAFLCGARAEKEKENQMHGLTLSRRLSHDKTWFSVDAVSCRILSLTVNR